MQQQFSSEGNYNIHSILAEDYERLQLLWHDWTFEHMQHLTVFQIQNVPFLDFHCEAISKACTELHTMQLKYQYCGIIGIPIATSDSEELQGKVRLAVPTFTSSFPSTLKYMGVGGLQIRVEHFMHIISSCCPTLETFACDLVGLEYGTRQSIFWQMREYINEMKVFTKVESTVHFH
jgi:hypothetical protein